MTVREICVRYGFEIDRNSEKRVKDAVENIKKMSSALLEGFKIVFRASGAEDAVKEIQDSIDSLRQAEKAAGETEDAFKDMGKSASDVGKEIEDAFKDIPETIPKTPEVPVVPETPAVVPENTATVPSKETNRSDKIYVDARKGIEDIAAASGKTMNEVLNDLERIASGYEQLGDDAETAMKKAFQDIQDEQKQIDLEKIAEESERTLEEVQTDLNRAASAYEQLGMDAETAMKRAYDDIIKDSGKASSEMEKMTVDVSSSFQNIAEESGRTIQEVVSDLRETAEAYEQFGYDAETAMRKAYEDIQKNQKMLSFQKIAEENKKTVDEIQRDLEDAADAYEKLGMDAETAMKRAYDDIIKDSERMSREVRQNEAAVENSGNGIIDALKKIAKFAAGAFAVTKIKEFGTECVEAAASANALSSQFEQTFGDLEGAATKGLNKIAKDTGVSVNRMKGSYAQIAAFAKTTGMSTEESLSLTKRSMTAIADSAAYYDRSLKDVTDSLQSFLKGNYENDAALGLSCTETTRNAAANKLYGKSFSDLSESEKQLTLLQMVEDANRLSGALGQAARESDTLENQTGNLKQAFTDFKAVVGNYLLQPAITGIKMLSEGIQYVTAKVPDMADAVKKAADGITGGEENVKRRMEQIHAIVKRLQPAAERMLSSVRDGVVKAVDTVRMLIDRFGGIENLLKLLAILAGAFLIAMNWGKITEGARMFVTMLKSIGKMFSFANLKILGIVALVVLLALVVEDFVNFLMGNDSLIGEIFDKAGIGADNAREAIFKAWNKIRDFLLDVWDFIKQAAGMSADAIKGFFEKHSESIRANFERTWGIIRTFLSGVWTFLSQLAVTLFGDTEDSINGSSTSTKDKLLAVWKAILDALSAVWDALYEVASAVFNAVATVIETVFSWIQAFWDAWGSEILSWFKVLWDSMGGIINGFLDIIKGIADLISSVFTGDWQGAWEAINEIFTGIWDVIVNFITAVWETIKLVFSMALEAISTAWNKIWGAVSSFFISVWNKLVSFISGVLTKIKTFFVNTFSSIKNAITNKVKDIKNAIVNGFTSAVNWIKNLPKEAVQWGSDLIGGIVDGITGAAGKVKDAVSGVADKIKSFLHFSVPDEGPLTDYESWMPDFMSGLSNGIDKSRDSVIRSIKGVAGEIAGAFSGFSDGQDLSGLRSFCSSAVNVLKETGSAAGNFLSAELSEENTLLSSFLSSASGLVQGNGDGIKGFVVSSLTAVNNFSSKTINNIQTATKTFLGAVNENYGSIFGNIQATVGNSFSAMQAKASSGMGKLKSIITSGLAGAFDDIKQLPKSAEQWGADMVQGIVDGITGAVGKVKDAVGNVADNIKSYLHFSVPDEGPLKDYENWMPDFMYGLAKGIDDNKDAVLDTVKTLADGMSVLIQAAVVKPETVTASTVNNTNQSSVNQYNTFSNTYTGSDREAVRNVSKGMKKSANDATTELARALEFSRG